MVSVKTTQRQVPPQDDPADYYGNLELMQTADPNTRFQLVQSVRKETYLRLMEIYTKLRDSLTKAEKNRVHRHCASDQLRRGL